MLNQLILIGRVIRLPDIQEIRNNFQIKIRIAVERNNCEISDTFDVLLWKGVASAACEKLKAGDIVAIKGRLENNGSSYDIIAERVSFINQVSPNEEAGITA